MFYGPFQVAAVAGRGQAVAALLELSCGVPDDVWDVDIEQSGGRSAVAAPVFGGGLRQRLGEPGNLGRVDAA